jgi:hypothetical protein
MHLSGSNSPQTWSCESSRMKSNDKSLEELDRILGIVHGAPFTEKKSKHYALVVYSVYCCALNWIFLRQISFYMYWHYLTMRARFQVLSKLICHL